MADIPRNMLPPSQGQGMAMGPRPGQPGMEMGLTPKDIIAIIRRHILLIIILTGVGAGLGVAGFIAMRMFNPQYTASTVIRVLSPETSNPTSLEDRIANKDIMFQFRQTNAAYIKTQDMLQNLLRRDKVRDTSWFKQFLHQDGSLNEAKAVRALEKKFGANADRETAFIRISMTCKSPKDAQVIVNEMMELFLRTMHQRATEEQRQRLATARDQEQSLRAELKAAEDSLSQIRVSNPNIAEFTTADKNSDVRHSIKVRRDTLEVRQSELEQQIAQIEAQIATLTKRATGDFDQIVREQIENDTIAIQARQRILLLRPEVARLISKLGENHRTVRQIRDELKQAEQELQDRQNYIAEVNRQADLQNAEDARTVLMSQMESYKRQLQDAQIEQKQLDNLRAQYSTYSEIKDKKIEQLDNISNLVNNLNLVINDPKVSKLVSGGLAPLPLQISSPRIILYGPGGFMLGLMAGLGLAFLIEMANDTIRTPAEVMRTLKVPLLGMICHSDDDDDLAGIDPYQVVRQAPYSITSECYRQFKTNFKLSSATTHQTIAFTSGAPGEGKTTVAVNLCATLVGEGKKVLLVDANFRRPTTAKLFPKTAENGSMIEHTDFGLSNYLMGQCEAENIIRHSAIDDLHIVDSGPLPANPSELLATPAMRRFLDIANQIYDYVILDSPPLLISDAKTIASISDATIVVFNATMTKKGAGQRTIRELAQINAPVIGSVLVAVRTMKGGYLEKNIQTYQDYQKAELAKQI